MLLEFFQRFALPPIRLGILVAIILTGFPFKYVLAGIDLLVANIMLASLSIKFYLISSPYVLTLPIYSSSY